MNIISALVVYGIIIALIVYYVKKRKQAEQDVQRKTIEESCKILEQEESVSVENRVADKKRIEEDRIFEYKAILDKLPQTIKKKLVGYVNYVRSSSSNMNLLLIGCPKKYESKILSVMAFDFFWGGVILNY